MASLSSSVGVNEPFTVNEQISNPLSPAHSLLRNSFMYLVISDDFERIAVYAVGCSAPSAEIASATILREVIERELHTLTPREEHVIKLRFGLYDGRNRTLEEVGKEFDITRERIRQIEAKALRKLRHPSRARHLRGFLD